jgi:hypothetical protein
MFDDQCLRVLDSMDEAHAAYHQAEVFGGPSIHFHHRSLQAARAQDFERCAEHVYAMLASWGMHRMGRGGSKMRDFEEFRFSLHDVWPAAMQLQRQAPDSLSENDWATLKTIFCGIRCMATGTSIVGNSKVMAHLLPNLIAPVDREYTLTFLFGNGQVTNSIELEWKTLVRILDGFFYPVVQSPLFQRKAAGWLAQGGGTNWDTSELKIVDNLVTRHDESCPGYPPAVAAPRPRPLFPRNRALQHAGNCLRRPPRPRWRKRNRPPPSA